MNDAIAYLNSLGLHKVKPGLERTIKLLEILGNPQEVVPSVLIAGTNGKGSVASAIASVLETQGYKTGLYTSPHLIRVSERIRINRNEISMSDLSQLILKVKQASSTLPDEPSYFEVLTVSAFLYFAQRKVDFSVLEVGMGGRLDATNVVKPILTVITNISKDHTEYLGESIREIAFEKAGIIKNRVPLVTGAKEEALSLIKSVAYENSAPISIFEKDFRVEGESTEDFSYFGNLWNLEHLTFGLHGFYQIQNASLSIAALESFFKLYEVNINEESLRKGLSSVRWEGRMEIVKRNPTLILDGAHNPSAAEALRESIKKMFPGTRFAILVGMLADKDHEGYMRAIYPIAECMIVTDVPSERTIKAEGLADVARRYVSKTKVIGDFKEAYKEILSLQKPVCVTGSLYLIGAIKQFFR